MDKNLGHIDPLVIRYLRGEELTPGELDTVNQWFQQSVDSKSRIRRLSDKEWLDAGLSELKEKQKGRAAVNYQALQKRIPWLNKPTRSIPIWIYIAAASVFLCLFVGVLTRYVTNRSSDTVAEKPLRTVADIQPGGMKATLTLANGQQIALDSVGTGIIAVQGNTQVNKQKGEIRYDHLDAAPEAIEFNTIETPRAGMYTIILPDLTKVWLNNASTLHYPTAFNGTTREVTLTGEAYFEVSKNKEKPFIVHAGEAAIRVLGTHFNISSYNDDQMQRITLLEGSVGVTSGDPNNAKVLKPGEQAQVEFTASGNSRHVITVLGDIDTDEVIAWKNGYFHFSHTDLSVALRQLARWYDVDVEYDGMRNAQSITGKIERDLPLGDILKGLSNGHVHFKIENRKIIVSP